MVITFALGYVLSRPAFPGRRFLYVFVLITMLFSGGMVPSFLLIRSLDLMNTRWSVILSCLLSTYYVVLVTNFIRSLPGSLLESARLDGASEATILVRIVLPLSKPIPVSYTHLDVYKRQIRRGGKSHFPEQKSFLCSFRARKSVGF